MINVTVKPMFGARAVLQVLQAHEQVDLVVGVPDSGALDQRVSLEWESAMALGKALTTAAESARMAVEDQRRKS